MTQSELACWNVGLRSKACWENLLLFLKINMKWPWRERKSHLNITLRQSTIMYRSTQSSTILPFAKNYNWN